MQQRLDILERKEDILKWIQQGKSKNYICEQLLCKTETLNSYLQKLGIEYKGITSQKGIKKNTNYKTAQEYIQSSYVKSHRLLEKLIRDGIKQDKCEICGVTYWQGIHLPLELHHKDCNHFNNDFDNLQILCPNCHSIQEGNTGANTAKYPKIKKKQKKECPICKKNFINLESQMCCECYSFQQRKAERPSREELKQLIRNEAFTKIAKKYNVSDNAIRKWCKAENLPSTKKEINSYSEEQWLSL